MRIRILLRLAVACLCLGLCLGLGAVLPAARAFALESTASADTMDTARLAEAVQNEEAALHARIGMAVSDTNGGDVWQYRGDERFPLNSTHKVFACAALLARVDAGVLAPDRRVSITESMLVVYSPITKKHLAPETMTLSEVCRASVSYSDNTAGNVVVDAAGGPAAVTAFMRSIGDGVTRLDRAEPELNEAAPGDPRDTTTPAAAAASLARVVLGDALAPSSRAALTDWMLHDQVADGLLRAALPPDWRIADKTGSGGHGSRSILAVVWPPKRSPLVVAIYITQTEASVQDANLAIARIGRVLREAVGR
ncbi:hypothetical protein dsx2_1119 [Desulfovibrio sp. X2]|nr:class A beta-lactamase [Desulfovibrio sp. X2]EPR37176.1 hypothetical protein dsx2_1119 [Desulfovibrio sp. X2]